MDPQHLDDRALFERVAHGESDAATWSTFIARFSRLCYHSIYRVIARHAWMTRADADELFQRFFEYMLADDRRALKRFRGENGCTVATYLAHMAGYRALEFVRKREKMLREQARVDDNALMLGRLADGGPSPEELLERRKLVHLVQRALETLSPSDQNLYDLHYVRGMSLADIAQSTSRSETAVHIQHFRLKERLRKVIGAEEVGVWG